MSDKESEKGDMTSITLSRKTVVKLKKFKVAYGIAVNRTVTWDELMFFLMTDNKNGDWDRFLQRIAPKYREATKLMIESVLDDE